MGHHVTDVTVAPLVCSGNTIKDPLFSRAIGVNCNMTGGSSGGPWFTNFDEGTGTGGGVPGR
jgi:hypothetical protein